MLQINYPEILPISKIKSNISTAIKEHQVVIVAGDTGSGKTTQLPKICLESSCGKFGLIGHTQPRRLAARSVASRIAKEMGSQLGEYVGYKVRFDEQVSGKTKIKLMTDGVLLAEIQHDRFLKRYDTIIIDEAHERSLNIDFILGYLKTIIPRRPDLKVIITSATIDLERFSQYFDGAPIIKVSSSTYPVETRYRPICDEHSSTKNQLEGLFESIDELCHEGEGDILIFMNGEREIHDTADALRKRNLLDVEIVSLYARLSSDEQNKIFQLHSVRRIVLATNIAETSLTVPGIKYVIDPGTARISYYSYRAKIQRLPIEPISQASANQRRGRCGRTAKGVCIRLYSEKDFDSRPEFTIPEILRTNLAEVILKMATLGLGDIQKFPFIEAPNKRNIQDGVRLLEELGAIKFVSGSNNLHGYNVDANLTLIGRQLACLPIDLRFARMVLEASKHSCLKELMIIVSALSIQDPREWPSDKKKLSDERHRRFFHAQSDFLTFVNLWRYIHKQKKILTGNQFRKQCKRDFLNCSRVCEWQDVYLQISQAMNLMNFRLNEQEGSYSSVHISILSGALSYVGIKDQRKNEYKGVRNIKFCIFPTSGLFKKQPKWIVSAELLETSKLWGHIVAQIQPDWIKVVAEHLLKRSYSEPHWLKKYAAVFAYERVMLYGLIICPKSLVNYGSINAALSRKVFIRSALLDGDWKSEHAFLDKNRKLLREVEELEHKSRCRNILVDDDQLFDFYDRRLAKEVVSGRHFDEWWGRVSKHDSKLLNFEKEMLFKSDADYITISNYPNFWYQNDFKLKLSYRFEPGSQGDGVTVHIPISVLNQIEPVGFDWHVPGLRRELVVSLIKALPKTLRKNFISAQNYADTFLSSVTSTNRPLLDVLEKELQRMTGVKVLRRDWNSNRVPEHLKMKFCVIDHQGCKLRESKDLNYLKRDLKDQIKRTLSKVDDDGIEQQGLKTWSFGKLPKVYWRKRGDFELKAYPALVDDGDSVAIKLFATEEEQISAMHSGHCRLILLNVPSPVRYLHKILSNKSKLSLYFNPYGKVLDLIDDCVFCSVGKLIEEKGGESWDLDNFELLREHVAIELSHTVVDVTQQVEKILMIASAINKTLKDEIDFTTKSAFLDIKTQVGSLVFSGFVSEYGWRRLPDILRYMRAIQKRIEKLSIDSHKDRLHMLKIESLNNDYKKLLHNIPKGVIVPENVKVIRWMIEELRVSYFAQQLGTSYTVSDKKVRSAIEACGLLK
ncbi:ATP-dependent RNA helicase hrpA [Candidatus Photodesmus blepharus]|uniref:ATP-dependent RNA helicase hrpA n=2 Tax=Candidatus Photodesmus blepharonis TaxID=1179155 RepID=A0A084CN54_9GAMM|nr:ATP-dependent RNA helicase hrpA [Candidatus Photodesmus blepharus]